MIMEKNVTSDNGGDHGNEFQDLMGLPTDITYNIFSRIQTKFIARCKLVRKAWYNHLSAPDFVHHYAKNKLYTTLVLAHSHVVPTRDTLFVTIINERQTLSILEISKDGNDCTRTTIILNFPLSRGLVYPLMRLEGSSNGFLCLRLHGRDDLCEQIYICNPASGKSCTPLPQHCFDKYPVYFFQIPAFSYLFGFSPSTNHFKVVKILHVMNPRNNTIHAQFEIFTVGVDTEWRHLEDTFNFHYPVFNVDLNAYEYPISGIDLNGNVCWLARNSYTKTTYIAAFDFGEEKVCHIPHPAGLVLNHKTMALVVFNCRVCLVDHSIPSQYTVWMMEEHGVAESWTKCVVSTRCFPYDPPVLHYPLANLRNGDIVFRHSKPRSLVFPNQEECTVADVLLGDVDGEIYYIAEFATLRGSFHEQVIMGSEPQMIVQLK